MRNRAATCGGLPPCSWLAGISIRSLALATRSARVALDHRSGSLTGFRGLSLVLLAPQPAVRTSGLDDARWRSLLDHRGFRASTTLAGARCSTTEGSGPRRRSLALAARPPRVQGLDDAR